MIKEQTLYSIEGNTDDSVLIRKTNRLNNGGSSYFDGFGSNGGSSFGDIPVGAISRGGRTDWWNTLFLYFV